MTARSIPPRPPSPPTLANRIDSGILARAIADELSGRAVISAVGNFFLLLISLLVAHFSGQLGLRVWIITVCLGLLFAARIWWAHRWNRSTPGAIPVRLWRNVFTTMIVLSSLAWLTLCFTSWFTGGSDRSEFFYFVVVLGMQSASFSALATSGRDFYGFIVPMNAAAMLFALRLPGSVQAWGTSGGILVYFGFNAMVRRHVYSSWLRGFSNNEWLSKILDTFPGGISILQKDQYVYANAAVSNLADLHGSPVGKPLGHTGVNKPFAVQAREFIAGTQDSKRAEFEINTDRGPRTHLVVFQRLSSFEDTTLLISIDVHDRVLAEREMEHQKAKMVEASRQAALAVMTAGVSHEINNPLAIILARTEMATLYLEKLAGAPDSTDSGRVRTELTKSIESITAAANRMAKIVAGLKIIGRNSERDPMEPVSMRKIMATAVEYCETKFQTSGITLRYEPPPEDHLLQCREVQISQVLINLLVNARDAASGSSEPWVSLRAYVDGESLGFIVQDSGPGIPADLVDKIMTPFFTTKPVGVGTGLGLSISKGILQDHGGDLVLDRTLPHTTFKVMFPRVTAVTAKS